MTITTYLHDLILGVSNAGLIAALGDRVSPPPVPESATYPYLTFQKLGGSVEIAHDGDQELQDHRYRLQVWGPDVSQLEEVKDYLYDLLVVNIGELNGKTILSFWEDDWNDFDETSRLHRWIVDINLKH